MSEFVNFGKRGIELPPGCKDLIDVLPKRSTATGEQRRGRRGSKPPEGLAHIEDYVSRLLASAKNGAVWIHSYEAPFAIDLSYGKRGLLALIFVSSDCEERVRTVLRDAGIHPTQDEPPGAAGDFSRSLVCWLPIKVAGTVRLVRDLIRKGCGMPENVQLDFSYREKPTA